MAPAVRARVPPHHGPRPAPRALSNTWWRSCVRPAQIDQAALTGESLPAKKFTGDVAFSGSSIKQGERHAVVYATGVNTFFGRAAALISGTNNTANLQVRHPMSVECIMGVGGRLLCACLHACVCVCDLASTPSAEVGCICGGACMLVCAFKPVCCCVLGCGLL